MSKIARQQDDGATAVEYALMLACIFVLILTAVSLLGTNLAAAFANVALSVALSV